MCITRFRVRSEGLKFRVGGLAGGWGGAPCGHTGVIGIQVVPLDISIGYVLLLRCMLFMGTMSIRFHLRLSSCGCHYFVFILIEADLHVNSQMLGFPPPTKSYF